LESLLEIVGLEVTAEGVRAGIYSFRELEGENSSSVSRFKVKYNQIREFL